MFGPRHFVIASAFATLMGGSAHAALTADQIWKSWQDGAAQIGLTISAATEAKSGSTLNLNGVSFAPAGEPALVTISDMTLTENSDGSVTITPGADIGASHGDASNGGSVKMTHEALVIQASEGDDGAIVYDYSAGKLDLSYQMTSEGFSFEEEASETPAPGKDDGRFSFADLEGSYIDTPGENRIFALAMTAAQVVYEVNSDHPSLEMKSSQSTTVEDIEVAGSLTMPSELLLADVKGAEDFATALRQGFAISLEGTQGVSKGTGSASDMFFPYEMSMEAGPGTFAFSLDQDKLHLASASDEGTKITLTTPMTEESVTLSIADMGIEMTSPVIAAEEAGDYKFALKLGQLTIDEAVWAMFDPGAALERAPFDFDFDFSGKARVDWPAMIAASDAGQPEVMPEPESLDINRANVKAAGAELDATGALTFDNSMGIPAPLGEANISLTGAEKLISGLIAVGAITEEDAMMARMMMGAIMVPGSAEDSLVSKLEFKEGFQIFANGQQIQ
ncbi:DUF2125 domain-containing protein [Pseudogemmobacter faecipullorum]|uniref:DUF2125 domain-containing protein n=1 Tax=Pseudogemmobacter faecipullorum TaxID=2755041 RepID=A0ABS8CPQ2_9RHOB|nr:DUF2125 domain-containing protein [Pseudogemmobacter faecipullorum]MCB5411341.1 DUF2125 domain-containing protein [Pseudogemmobacter faecipullorum]